jgi:hypothetical protein
MNTEEFHDLYFMSDMININKSRIFLWVGHIARMGNNRKYIKFIWKTVKKYIIWKTYIYIYQD